MVGEADHPRFANQELTVSQGQIFGPFRFRDGAAQGSLVTGNSWMVGLRIS
jgi:hypothetical protein